MIDLFKVIFESTISLFHKDPLIGSLAFLALAMLAAVCVIIPIQFIAFISEVRQSFDRRSPAEVEPRIAYKRAWLMGDGFRGVIGKNYDVDEEADGPGFHAYKTFEKALNHPQLGNVYLEVLLSGTIIEHGLGYKASHQRVLQIIIGSCASCERPATYYSTSITSGGEKQPIFVCRKHASVMSNRLPLRIIQSLRKSSSSVDYHKPVGDLVNDFPKLKLSNVVVAPYDGEEAFTPTELPKTDEILALTLSEIAR